MHLLLILKYYNIWHSNRKAGGVMQQDREGMQERAMAGGAGTMAGGAAGATVGSAAGGIIGWEIGMTCGGLIGLVAGMFLGLAIAKSNQNHRH
jgi:hypothetical protein